MLDDSTVEALRRFDGKRVAPLQELADEIAIRPDALELTISIIDSDETNAHVGGTWILKRLLELGLETDELLCRNVIAWLDHCPEKDARLHLLQILDLIEVPKTCHKRLYDLALGFTSDRNTLVRVWAYNALGIVAQQNQKFKAETLERFDNALKTDSASVKARIRNRLKVWRTD